MLSSFCIGWEYIKRNIITYIMHMEMWLHCLIVVAASYDYNAFSNIISKTGAANNSIQYAGYQHDESRFYYLNARYYDSVMARFITEEDPQYIKTNDPLSLNLYTNYYNEPIKYIDPSGHYEKDVQVVEI